MKKGSNDGGLHETTFRIHCLPSLLAIQAEHLSGMYGPVASDARYSMTRERAQLLPLASLGLHRSLARSHAYPPAKFPRPGQGPHACTPSSRPRHTHADMPKARARPTLGEAANEEAFDELNLVESKCRSELTSSYPQRPRNS